VLGSGSGGNSIAFWDSETAFLIDAGFSCKELANRLGQIGKDIKDFSTVFISHEHVDHIRGASVLSRRVGADIVCTKPIGIWLNRNCGIKTGSRLEPGTAYRLNGISIAPFEVPHDATQTIGFSIKAGDCKVSIATDLGHMPAPLLPRFRDCDALILESNHDIEMLKSGPYPWFLKNRIMGKLGHLSNLDSSKALARVISPRTKHVTLAHLSQENNLPEIALGQAKKTISEKVKRQIKVTTASQFEVGEIIKLK
jgi:phosphoribosyl 1,2-cyclic phosphodiesterase